MPKWLESKPAPKMNRLVASVWLLFFITAFDYLYNYSKLYCHVL